MIREAGQTLESGFRAFFEGDLEGMEKIIVELRSCLKKANALAPQTNPNLAIVPGVQKQFKFDLFMGVLGKMRLLLSDLEMLLLAMSQGALAKGSEEGRGKRFYNLMNSHPSFSVMKADLLQTQANCFRMLLVVLEHSSEDRLENEHLTKLEGMTGILELAGADEFYEEVNASEKQERSSSRAEECPLPEPEEAELDQRFPSAHQDLTGNNRARLVVAVRALCNATRHTGEIDMLCLHEDIY